MKRLALLIVLLIVSLAPMQATAQSTEEVPCLTYNVSGIEYEAITDELAQAARNVSYVTRIEQEYMRMIQPATDWQIALYVYCVPGISFDQAYNDVMWQVITINPARWGHYAAILH